MKINNSTITTIKIIVHFCNYSPTIVKVTVLPLLGPSNSMKKTDCQVPKSNFKFFIGNDSLDESKIQHKNGYRHK